MQVDEESGRLLSLFSQVEETVAIIDETLLRIEAISARLETVDAPETDAPRGLQSFLSEASAAVTAIEVRIIVRRALSETAEPPSRRGSIFRSPHINSIPTAF